MRWPGLILFALIPTLPVVVHGADSAAVPVSSYDGVLGHAFGSSLDAVKPVAPKALQDGLMCHWLIPSSRFKLKIDENRKLLVDKPYEWTSPDFGLDGADLSPQGLFVDRFGGTWGMEAASDEAVYELPKSKFPKTLECMAKKTSSIYVSDVVVLKASEVDWCLKSAYREPGSETESAALPQVLKQHHYMSLRPDFPEYMVGFKGYNCPFDEAKYARVQSRPADELIGMTAIAAGQAKDAAALTSATDGAYDGIARASEKGMTRQKKSDQTVRLIVTQHDFDVKH